MNICIGKWFLCVCVSVCGFSACLSHARQNNYMSSCPFGCCNLLCVCGFPPSDPPHTQAIPYTSNSMPKGAHLGFMILCVCLDFLPLAAQHYTQTSITWQTAHMDVEISCVCGFPPSDPPHTQAISCQEVFIYGLQSLSNSWFQSLNNSVGKQIQSLNNSVSSRVCIFPPARSVWLCFKSQTSTSQTLS